MPEGKKMSHFDGGNLKIYKEMVRSLDKNVGLVLDSLDKAGVSDNTIVVFTSDNGGERFSDTWPLVGAKTELLEGGIRVPVLIRWPVRIKSKSTSNQAIISMDFLPTLLAAAGGEPDPAYVPDGENLLPELLGDAPSRSRRLFWRYRAEEQIAMRDGDWKYLKIAGNEYLFNLSKDQRERANLSAIHPERFESMKTLYAKWNEKMLPYTSRTGSHNVKQDKWVDRY